MPELAVLRTSSASLLLLALSRMQRRARGAVRQDAGAGGSARCVEPDLGPGSGIARSVDRGDGAGRSRRPLARDVAGVAAPRAPYGLPHGRLDGSEMIAWTGTAGGRYDPSTDAWSLTSTAPAGVGAVWTGAEMIVDQGRCDPSTDTRAPIAESGAPRALEGQTIVWTGAERIYWGGGVRTCGSPGHCGTSGRNAGGRYEPSTDTWADT